MLYCDSPIVQDKRRGLYGSIDQEIMINNDDHLVKLYDTMLSLDDTISESHRYDVQVLFNIRRVRKWKYIGSDCMTPSINVLDLEYNKRNDEKSPARRVGYVTWIQLINTSRDYCGQCGSCTWSKASYNNGLIYNTRIETLNDCFLQHISWSTCQTLNHCFESTGLMLARKSIHERSGRFFSSSIKCR